MAGPILEWVEFVRPEVTIEKPFDPAEYSYVSLTFTGIGSITVKSRYSSFLYKMSASVSGPYVFPQDFEMVIDDSLPNRVVYIIWANTSQEWTQPIQFMCIDPRTGDIEYSRPELDPEPDYNLYKLLIEENPSFPQFVLKFDEGFTDYVSYEGGTTDSQYFYQLDPAGTYYYDKNTATFSETGSGLTYSRTAMTFPIQSGGEDFDAFFTTGNLVLSSSPYVFGNNKLYIHTATSMAGMSMAVFKGARYNTPPSKALPMNGDVSETARWLDGETQPYRYTKQLFIKETTALTEKDQAIKIKLSFPMPPDAYDEVAVNSIFIKAGEHIITGGSSI